MKNVGSIIKSHNACFVKKDHQKQQEKECNCGKKEDCPHAAKCLSNCITYKATTSDVNNGQNHIKDLQVVLLRYRNHTKSVQHQKYSKETDLLKHIWDLKKGCGKVQYYMGNN